MAPLTIRWKLSARRPQPGCAHFLFLADQGVAELLVAGLGGGTAEYERHTMVLGAEIVPNVVRPARTMRRPIAA